MPSLLIFCRPVNPDLTPEERILQNEPGDVIAWHENNAHHWGKAVQGPHRICGPAGEPHCEAHPLCWWQVVVVKKAVKFGHFKHLLAGVEDPREIGRPSWRHRVHRIDLERLGGGRQPGLNEVWTVTLEELLACASVKPETQQTVEIG